MKFKRGISGVVATVLILLITVVAAGLVVSFVLPFVQNNLRSSSECLQYKDYLKFDPDLGYTCYDAAGLHGFTVRAETLGEQAIISTQQKNFHSADLNKDWRLTHPENKTFLDLYGYRSGGIRTGEYHIDSTVAGGYAPGPGTQTAGQEHSGDYNDNWRIEGTELSRFHVLFNSRTNGVITGEYHVDPTTEDGYDPGPAEISAISEGNNSALKGFNVVFINKETSRKVDIFSGASASSASGGVRMLDRSQTTIVVPRDGEALSYVYNGNGVRFDKIELYPVLQSGRLCDMTHTVQLKTCTGVTLTP